MEALFLVSPERLGIGRSESHEPPVWFELAKVVKLDAIGEPDNGFIQIEMAMEDGTVVSAGWPEPFCARVVESLSATRPEDSTEREDSSRRDDQADDVASTFSVTPVVRRRSRRNRNIAETPIAASRVADASTVIDAPAPEAPSTDAPSADAPSAEAPAPDVPSSQESIPSQSHSALELEDVTYLGGLPGQARRRKRCVATLTTDGLVLKGPGDLAVSLSWEKVRAIETQNSDEARFRTNTKIHRDSSALVIDCEDGATVILEARDCPTVPLRAAINQLLADQPVEVI